MKKVLLSLAVIVSSGGYVAFENASSQAGSAFGLSSLGGGALSSTALPSLNLDTSAKAAEPARQQATAALNPVSPPLPARLTPPAPAETAAPVQTASAAASLQRGVPQPAPNAAPAAPPAPVPAPIGQVVMTPVSSTVAAAPSDNSTPNAPAPAALPADLATRRKQAQSRLSQHRSSGSGILTTADLRARMQSGQSTAASSATIAQSGLRTGTFRGPSENAFYGRVQLAAVVQSGQLESIEVLQYPNDRRHSQYLSSIALPMLEREAIRAQSANINVISGATLTSEAFIHSLRGALSAARS